MLRLHVHGPRLIVIGVMRRLCVQGLGLNIFNDNLCLGVQDARLKVLPVI